MRKTAAILLWVCALAACTGPTASQNTISGIGGPNGDAGGTYGMVADFASTRIRCSSTSKSDGNFEVQCQTVAVDSQGNEHLATSLAEGVTIQWGSAQVLQGSVETLSCFNNTLTQTCSVSLTSGATAQLGFSVMVSNTVQQKMETDSVYLPYTIVTNGFTPQIPISYSPPVAGQTTLGFQNNSFDAKNGLLINQAAVCAVGSTIYFASQGYIYSIENGQVSVFAGSPNSNNFNEYSYRLRTFLGSGVLQPQALACSADGVYISQSNYGRILGFQQDGPVGQLAVQTLTALGPFFPVNLPFGLSLGPDKSVYSISDAGVIYRISPTGDISKNSSLQALTLAASGVGTLSAASIAVGADSSIYVSIPNGGIFKLDSQGNASTLLSGTGYNPAAMTVDTDGSLYFVDTVNSAIQKLNPTGVVSVFAALSTTYTSIATGPNGSFILGGSRIDSVSSSGTVTTLLGPPANSPFNIPSSQFVFTGVTGLAPGPGNTLYVAQPNQVVQIAADTTVGLIASEGVKDIVLAPDGSLYLLETTIRKRTPDGVISTYYSDGRVGSARAMALGPDGSLYLALGFMETVMKISPTGTATIVAGNGTAGSSGDGGPALSAQLFYPSGVVVMADGSLLIADGYNESIRKVSANGIISTIAGGGPQGGWDGSESPALSVGLYIPSRIASADGGNAYFSDSQNTYLLKPAPDGSYTIVMLTGGLATKDCGTGVVQNQATSANLFQSLNTSLSKICVGQPQAIASTNTCGQPKGNVTLYYGQLLGMSANIVGVTYPCSD